MLLSRMCLFSLGPAMSCRNGKEGGGSVEMLGTTFLLDHEERRSPIPGKGQVTLLIPASRDSDNLRQEADLCVATLQISQGCRDSTQVSPELYGFGLYFGNFLTYVCSSLTHLISDSEPLNPPAHAFSPALFPLNV